MDSLDLKFRSCHLFNQFKAMPFGLASALRIFTRLDHPITLFCRHLDICVISCLDDSIIMACSQQVLIQHHDLVLRLLQRLGQSSKIRLPPFPSQQFVFLGLQLDTQSGTISLPLEKQSKFQLSASYLLSQAQVTCLHMQRFLGLTNFACFAVPCAWLHSQALQGCLS